MSTDEQKRSADNEKMERMRYAINDAYALLEKQSKSPMPSLLAIREAMNKLRPFTWMG